MSHRQLKEEEITRLVKIFLSADTDNDGKISIKQLCKIMGQDFNDFTKNEANKPSNKYSLIALVGTIKVDFLTFLEFHKKHQLSNAWKQYISGESHDEDEIMRR